MVAVDMDGPQVGITIAEHNNTADALQIISKEAFQKLNVGDDIHVTYEDDGTFYLCRIDVISHENLTCNVTYEGEEEEEDDVTFDRIYIVAPPLEDVAPLPESPTLQLVPEDAFKKLEKADQTESMQSDIGNSHCKIDGMKYDDSTHNVTNDIEGKREGVTIDHNFEASPGETSSADLTTQIPSPLSKIQPVADAIGASVEEVKCFGAMDEKATEMNKEEIEGCAENNVNNPVDEQLLQETGGDQPHHEMECEDASAASALPQSVISMEATTALEGMNGMMALHIEDKNVESFKIGHSQSHADSEVYKDVVATDITEATEKAEKDLQMAVDLGQAVEAPDSIQDTMPEVAIDTALAPPQFVICSEAIAALEGVNGVMIDNEDKVVGLGTAEKHATEMNKVDEADGCAENGVNNPVDEQLLQETGGDQPHHEMECEATSEHNNPIQDMMPEVVLDSASTTHQSVICGEAITALKGTNGIITCDSEDTNMGKVENGHGQSPANSEAHDVVVITEITDAAEKAQNDIENVESVQGPECCRELAPIHATKPTEAPHELEEPTLKVDISDRDGNDAGADQEIESKGMQETGEQAGVPNTLNLIAVDLNKSHAPQVFRMRGDQPMERLASCYVIFRGLNAEAATKVQMSTRRHGVINRESTASGCGLSNGDRITFSTLPVTSANQTEVVGVVKQSSNVKDGLVMQDSDMSNSVPAPKASMHGQSDSKEGQGCGQMQKGSGGSEHDTVPGFRKRPLTPVFAFINEHRAELMKREDCRGQCDVSKKGAELYKALSDDERAKYQKKYDEEKKVYDAWAVSDQGKAVLAQVKAKRDAKKAPSKAFTKPTKNPAGAQETPQKMKAPARAEARDNTTPPKRKQDSMMPAPDAKFFAKMQNRIENRSIVEPFQQPVPSVKRPSGTKRSAIMLDGTMKETWNCGCIGHLRRHPRCIFSQEHQPCLIHLRDHMLIGRNETCDVVMDSKRTPGMISRLHAMLQQEDSIFSISDNHSVNGVLINGKKVHNKQPLTHGDTVTFGVPTQHPEFDYIFEARP